jgi:hypothetical protein
MSWFMQGLFSSWFYKSFKSAYRTKVHNLHILIALHECLNGQVKVNTSIACWIDGHYGAVTQVLHPAAQLQVAGIAA